MLELKKKIGLDVLRAEKMDIFSSSDQMEAACLNTGACTIQLFRKGHKTWEKA